MPHAKLAVSLTLNDELSKSIDNVKRNISVAGKQIQGSFAKVNASIAKTKARLKTLATSFKANWLQITAAITASLFAINKAFDLIKLSAKFDQQEEAFRNLAAANGASADQIIADLKKMSGETLSTSKVMEKASQAMILGLAPDKLPKLMEIARASARAFGKDVDFMFESIVLGIGRQSRLVLDNLGIIVKAEAAYESYAKQLGRTAKSLDDAERRQAFANAAMVAGEKIIKDIDIQMKSNLETIQSLGAFWEDFRIKAGNSMIAIIQMTAILVEVLRSGLAQAISGIANAFTFLTEKIAIALEFYGQLIEKIPGIDDPLARVADKLNQISLISNDFAISMTEGSMEFAEAAVDIANLLAGVSGKSVLNIDRIRVAMDKLKEDTKVVSDTIGERMAGAVTRLGTAMAAAEVLGKNFAKAGAAVAMGMAIVNTAQAATKAYADYGWPFGLVAAGIIAAAGAIEVATIAAQTFHKGGMIRAHEGMAVDEVPIIAQTGEGILSRQGMNNLGGAGALNALNAGQSSNGGDVTVNVYYPKMTSRNEVDRLANQLGFEINKQLKFAGGV